jgi:hypothetical protein
MQADSGKNSGWPRRAQMDAGRKGEWLHCRTLVSGNLEYFPKFYFVSTILSYLLSLFFTVSFLIPLWFKEMVITWVI